MALDTAPVVAADGHRRRACLSALLALAIGGFGIGLTEFVIAGLLPEVAATYGVDEAAAGWLISGYALSVAVGAIGLTAAVDPAQPQARAGRA